MRWKSATYLFLSGYLVASVAGYALYLISPAAMWIGVFTIMPVVFASLACIYFNERQGPPGPAEILKLAGYWIGWSFLLDALIYVVLLPMAGGAGPNWTFFLDQWPWIWLSYASLTLVVAAGSLASRLSRQRESQRGSTRPLNAKEPS